MSEDQKPQENQPLPASAERQPIFNLPLSVLVLCGLLLAIQAASDLVLNEDGRQALYAWFAFIPYRVIDASGLDGGVWPIIWTPFTHAFLHAGWEHVGFNVVWLAAFGTPIAQRYGAVRMLALFLVGAALGAVAFAVTTLPQVQVLLGASGGIAALTGAATRFIFQPPVVAVDEKTGERQLLGRRLATLGEFFRNPTARLFALAWIVLNGIVPLIPMFTGSNDFQVAWQAHIAGFLGGLLLVPLLERRRA
ncbi:MAG TPA: rhomboid family intramembrane serine protease [Devosia sp.]|jgi:membrane associated rhomboid family serine protease|nr:rhomboid family intramembrane serine protease [Devosia sp.]